SQPGHPHVRALNQDSIARVPLGLVVSDRRLHQHRYSGSMGCRALYSVHVRYLKYQNDLLPFHEESSSYLLLKSAPETFVLRISHTSVPIHSALASLASLIDFSTCHPSFV